MIALLITLAVIYVAYHAGHAHADYRHGRARGHRGINLYWSSVRGHPHRPPALTGGHAP